MADSDEQNVRRRAPGPFSDSSADGPGGTAAGRTTEGLTENRLSRPATATEPKHVAEAVSDDKENKSDDDQEAEDLPVVTELSGGGPAATQEHGRTTTDVLEATLKDVSPRWRNWIVRTIFSTAMIGGFSIVVYFGPVALVFLIITIGYIVYKSHELPWFRTLSWYFLITSNYFFYGESMIQYFGVLMSRTEFLNPLVTYHRFISFSLYVAGLVAFVFSLVKKHYLKQFTMFGWTHVTLLIIVTQSHMCMQNIFEGLIWFLVPVSMIICNDIMAYMFGFFFGKTPLIKLSPKKTWEGFIGGAFSTVILGLGISYFLLQFDRFVCPIEYDEVKEALSVECERGFVFRLHDYTLPSFVQNIGILVCWACLLFFIVSALRQDWKTLTMYPFMLHSISMSIFASVIGPFGGFFASGFKRAFKIKDFGDTIPGHGGFMDRFDCQLIMATFVHVYNSSFINGFLLSSSACLLYTPKLCCRAVSAQKLVQHILTLKPNEQLEVFHMLRDALTKRGLFAAQ